MIDYSAHSSNKCYSTRIHPAWPFDIKEMRRQILSVIATRSFWKLHRSTQLMMVMSFSPQLFLWNSLDNEEKTCTRKQFRHRGTCWNDRLFSRSFFAETKKLLQQLECQVVNHMMMKFLHMMGKFHFAAKSKLAKNNLYLRENKCFPSQEYKECTLIPLAI